MLVGTDATSAGEVLAERYPALNEVLELKTLEIEPDSPQFYKMRFQPGMSRESRFDQVFVCLDDDEQALTCALAMRQKLLGQGVRIIAKLMHDQGLAALMRGEAGGEPEFSDIHTFGLIENTCTPDLMLGGTHEALAQSIHDSYRRKQIVKGQTRLNNPSLVPWSELPDALKDSNRRQADHIGMKLKKIRRGIKPLKDWNAKLDEFSSEDIEFLAKLEHARWVKERSAAGWRYAPGSKNLDRKTSPFLVPWEDLTEDAKDLDRETVRSLPIFLAQAGFEIFPLEEH
ncbi:MAG: hypothetical protein KZQ77_01040 [Candidatus Thiodiazotropha sp. (ex Notomyrtea botanica)]|nr:hypothetical protein [Candidatus Thiodiazotropha sp. (ex Notomyrtea botanica)]